MDVVLRFPKLNSIKRNLLIVHDILKNISDTDCIILGFNPKYSRPEDMIIKTFPVPPVQVRPTAISEPLASTMADDLTRHIANIIKANLRFRKFKETLNSNTVKYTNDHINFLQFHCAVYIDNESLSLPRSEQKNKPIKSLTSRLSGKEGHFRGNLMGKRTDHCSRTVIGSDPTIEINELRVPVNIAKSLTFPELVTKHNIEHLKKLIRNGANEYPGANFVFPLSSQIVGKRVLPIDLRYRKEGTEIRYGDIVERHLADGDIVLFNRQPTLHKVSMMAHRVKVINDPNVNSFGMSVYVCKPYNADFDGDEMNMFLSQSIQTQIELEEIADVKKQIINPSTSKTIIGVEQDGLIGSFNMTDSDVKVDWRTAMNIVSYTSYDHLEKFEKREYTGQELFSMTIPDKINLSKGDVKIVNGEIKSGKLTKDVLGAGKENSIHQLILDEYGSDETVNFLNNNQRLINNFNMHNGFTIGIDDMSIKKEIQQQIYDAISTKNLTVEAMITDMENNPDEIDGELFERMLFSEIDIIRSDIASLIKNNQEKTNNVFIMDKSGAKGSDINTGQMSGCVGMQAIEGSIVKKKINGRALPYFFQNDDRGEARGLIKDSLLNGINYPAFFFMNQSARIGMMDGAIKTAQSGYVQRKLVKTMEDALINYDCTLRGVHNNIIQFVYADNGVDTRNLFTYNVKLLELGNKELEDKIKFSDSELKAFDDFNKKDNDKLFEEVKELRDATRMTQIKSRLDYISFNNSFKIPININRIISSAIINTDKEDKREKLTPTYVLKEINELLENEKTMMLCMNKSIDKDKSIKRKDEKLVKTSLKLVLLDSLHPKRVIQDLKMTKYKFDMIIKNIIDTYNKNIVQPGEYVGILAAQAMGEPVSQMSMSYDTRILVNDMYHDFIKEYMIGEFIDEMMKCNKEKVVELKEHPDSYVLDTEKDRFYVINISNKEKSCWQPIEQVSCHPANGRMMTVKTLSGRVAKSTMSHSFLKRTAESIQPVRGSELKIGDRVPVLKNISISNPQYNVNDVILSRELGMICGEYIINKQIKYPYLKESDRKFIIENFTDGIREDIFLTNIDFINGFIKSYYENNGEYDSRENSITISCANEQQKRIILLLLNNNNIYGKINVYDNSIVIIDKYSDLFRKVILFEDIDVEYGYDRHDIIPEVSSVLIEILEKVKLDDDDKIQLLENIENNCVSRQEILNYIALTKDSELIEKLYAIYNSDVIWDEIVEINYHQESDERVYDLTVPDNDCFMVNDGLIVHNTLKAFHKSGIGSVSDTLQGVPRIQELLSLTKKIKTPQMIIYLTDEYKQNKDMANKISSYIRYTTFGQIRDKLEVIYDPEPYAKDGYMEKDNVFNIYYTHNATKTSCQTEITNLPWLMRIKLNREKMIEKEVTMLEIKSKFCNQWEKRYNDIKNIKKEEKYILDKIIQCSVLSNSDNDETPIMHIRFDMTDFDFDLLNDFIDIIIDKFKLKGIPNVLEKTASLEEPVINFNNDNQEFVKENQQIIYTQGVNLYDIRYLTGIDVYKTICNDVVQMYNVFGVEAARASLVHELYEAFSRHGVDVNYSHLSVLVDMMSINGFLASVDRHGMNKSDNEPLSRVSFEKMVEQLITAAVFNETDNMKSVSSRIMAGLVVKGGTGMCNVILNTNMLEKSEYVETIGDYDTTYKEINKSNIIDDLINKEEIEDMFMPM